MMNKPQRAWRSFYDLSRATPGRFLIKEDGWIYEPRRLDVG